MTPGETQIDPTARVDPQATIGPGAVIGPFCTVGPNVTLGERVRLVANVHISGHTTDLEQTVDSMEVEHAKVESAGPADDVALHVNDHVREHDKIFREG